MSRLLFLVLAGTTNDGVPFNGSGPRVILRHRGCRGPRPVIHPKDLTEIGPNISFSRETLKTVQMFVGPSPSHLFVRPVVPQEQNDSLKRLVLISLLR